MDVRLGELLDDVVEAVRDTGTDEQDPSLGAFVVGAVVIIGKQTALDIDEKIVVNDASFHVAADRDDRVNGFPNVGVDLVGGKFFHKETPEQEMLNLHQELIFTL